MNPFRRADISLGSNIIPSPNGPFSGGGWTLDGLTETTGQTDPLGGSTASLLTDTAANVLHRFYQQSLLLTPIGKQYLFTGYFKPGTYTGGLSWLMFDGVFSGMTVTSGGVASNFANATGMSVVSVGGFFKCQWIYTVQTSTAGGFFVPCFGVAGQSPYLGTVQNQTVWGMALQPIFYP